MASRDVLVIVESPAKAQTIERCLGKGYSVLSTLGHLIDLPKSRIGIDLGGSFEPEYLTVRGRAPLLREVQKAARKASLVLLASDNDREGEALAWQLRKILLEKLPTLPIQRIAFNEITPEAIKLALGQPQGIDETKVMAQKARRVLDRLVGYNLSPLLWKKVKRGLSAGRVQSTALRLICERERQLAAFSPEAYWTIEAEFRKGRRAFSARLISLGQAEAQPGLVLKEEDAKALVSTLEGQDFLVGEARETERILFPQPPLTTAGLLRAAAVHLGFSVKKTMLIASQLYEGIDVGRNRLGLITYLRTDSVRVADPALAELRAYVAGAFPAELPPSPNTYSSSPRVQDAHEAIRPTLVLRTPASLLSALSKDQHRLYTLIWEYYVASQMSPTKLRVSAIDVAAGKALFRVESSRVVERGFQKAATLLTPREKARIPELLPGEGLRLLGLSVVQHRSAGPERFTEASLVQALEEGGLGRPSTYAPVISVLLERYYLSRAKGELVPTPLGLLVSDILTEAFPDVVDPAFTARMEEGLDSVENGASNWVDLVRDFYGPFKVQVDRVMEGLETYRGSLDEATDLVCGLCGKPMAKRIGRFGYFLACTGFPACHNTQSMPLGPCPRCGQGQIVARRKATGRGREFYGCTRFPDCDYVSFDRPVGHEEGASHG